MGGRTIKGNFILKIKDSYNEESFEKLAGEMEGELKEDIENIVRLGEKAKGYLETIEKGVEEDVQKEGKERETEESKDRETEKAEETKTTEISE